jgi:hypothetical protein
MESQMTATNDTAEELTAEAFAEKMFSSLVGALDTLDFYAGERLGWYQALADHGPLTSADLARFRSVDVLPIQDFAFFRFYQLNH